MYNINIRGGDQRKGVKEMKKQYLVVYENNDGDIFKKVYHHQSKKEALTYFKELNKKYGYKVIAIRELTTNNIYL